MISMHDRTGFTLIELLVVVAIIAILASILFPIFAGAKEQGRQTRCLANLKQLHTAMRMYCDDNNGRMPSTGTWMNGWYPVKLQMPDWCGGDLNYPVGSQVYPEKGSLFPYTKTRRIYVCPTDAKMPAEDITDPNTGKRPCRNFNLSYSMNWFLHFYKIDTISPYRVRKVLMLQHEGRDSINDGLLLWNQTPGDDMPSKVHNTGTTAVYVDGHARRLPYREMLRIRESWNTFDEWKCRRNQENPNETAAKGKLPD